MWMRIGLSVILAYVCGTGYLTYAASQRIQQIEALTGESYEEVRAPLALPTAPSAAARVPRHASGRSGCAAAVAPWI